MTSTCKRPDVLKDLLAGFVLTAVLVPVGMGYAQAAGLQPIYGLYATIVPLITYAIFGTSRILVLGPDSSLAALIAATILPLAAGDAARALSLAGMLAVLSGTMCIAAGLARFGFVTEVISKPIRYGYVNGIALTVLVGQLPAFLGFSVNADGFLQQARALLAGLLEGRINWAATAISLCSTVVILGCRCWFPAVPGVLLAVAGSTLVVASSDLAVQAGISVIGPLPQGLPAFRFPTVSLSDLQSLFSGAIAIALVSFADTSVLSRIYAQRGGYHVDASQELISLGISNVMTGLFLIFEGQYAVGDMVEISGLVGLVEAITLRTTAIRNDQGELLTIPNRNIAVVGNYRDGAVHTCVDVAVAGREAVPAATARLEMICREVYRQFAGVLRARPETLGVVALETGEVFVRLLAAVWPGQAWVVEQQMVPRIREQFAAGGLTIPGDRVVVFHHFDQPGAQQANVVEEIKRAFRLGE